MLTAAEFKAQNPGAYAAVVLEGAEQGVTQERDRITAHLTMGSASGDMKTAMDAIAAGDQMTATHQATYMAAGMNKKAVDTRTADEIAAAEALGNADIGDVEAKDLAASTNLTNLAAELCGVDLEVKP